MDRLACISLPSFPLQLALRHFPKGHRQPLVLVKEDRPSSTILSLNPSAKAEGLRVGMRYSEALSIVCDLKAVTVSTQELALAREQVLSVLQNWSPVVEACPFDSASFWLGAGGLSGLYGTEAQWGQRLREALAREGYHAVVVVGLTRGGTYVLAKSRRRSTVLKSLEAEKRALAEAPLSVFPLTTRHRRLLEKLGITSLAAVLEIPPEELSRRLGPDLVRDLRRLEVLRNLPLQVQVAAEPVTRSCRLEGGVANFQALLPLLEAPLVDGLQALQRKARLMSELRMVFVLESGDWLCEVLRPAEPTTSARILLRLIELRLGQLVMATAVVELRLAFHDVALPPSSGDLFAPVHSRDLGRGGEALALIRAQWGNAAVVRPVLLDSHLPEGSFRWEPSETLGLPRPRPAAATFPTAVRRVRWTGSPDNQNPSGQRLGPSCRLQMSLGHRRIDRDYWFLRNGRREVSWVSWDRLDQKAQWEGMVD